MSKGIEKIFFKVGMASYPSYTIEHKGKKYYQIILGGSDDNGNEYDIEAWMPITYLETFVNTIKESEIL